MKRTLPIAICFVLTLGIASAQSLKKAIHRMNVDVTRALKNKDMAKFEKITRPNVTSDFKHIDMGKTQSYDEMLTDIKQSFGMIQKFTSASATTNKIRINGDTATSVSHHRMAGIMMGPDNKKHRMLMVGATHDTYRKEDGKWKLAVMEWFNEKMTLDGKPFNPAAMSGGADHH